MKPPRIVFMGTPEFAVPCLEALVAAGKSVVGVVTAVDKPQGRGQKAGISAVKACAQKHGLRVLQPPNLKAPEFIDELKSLEADLQIVVAFRMLPEVVWAMPRLGTFNLHASLLPRYRGAAPINWAIINGETETGVTTFFLQHDIDTGNIIFQEKEPIGELDTVGTLYERLMHRGAALVVKTVNAIENGTVIATPQIFTGTEPHAPKIFKETAQIKWDQPAVRIRDFVRGLNPYPAAWTVWNGKQYKIFEVKASDDSSSASIGKLESDSKTFLNIRCQSGWVSILELQPEGKKRMRIDEFFRGNKL
jgi:methionyl-tRNA formyltransferase